MASLNAEQIYEITIAQTRLAYEIIKNFETKSVVMAEYSQEDRDHITQLKKEFIKMNCYLLDNETLRNARKEIIGHFHTVLLRSFEWNCIMEGKGEEFRETNKIIYYSKYIKQFDESRAQDFLKFEKEAMTSLQFKSRFAIPLKPLFNFRHALSAYGAILREFRVFHPNRNVELLNEYENIRIKIMIDCFGDYMWFDNLQAFVKKWNEAMKKNDEESYDPLSEEITEGSYYLTFKLQEF
jgi:hypothetical protein